MKRIKKIVSMMLAVMMVLGMSMTVLADEPEPSTHETNKHTITITDTSNEGYEYKVYQVFKGDLYTNEKGEKVLSNIDWGNGVNGEAILTALRSEPLFGTVFTEKDGENYKINTAAEVAAVLATLNNVQPNGNETAEELDARKKLAEQQIDKFSEIVGANVTAEAATSWNKTGSGEKGDKAPWTYSVNVTGDGYYLVKNSKVPDAVENPDGSVTGYTETRYILQVVGDVSVAAKADAPEVDKNVLATKLVCGLTEGEDHTHVAGCYETEKTKFSNGAIGDTVDFVVDSKVPNMDGYEKYFFVMKDELSEGLTFKGNIEVTIGGVTLTQNPIPAENDSIDRTGKSYYVKLYKRNDAQELVPAAADELASVVAFEIVFENFIQYKPTETTAEADRAIQVTYSAEINDKVLVGTTGAKNTLELIYSKNPNETGEGTPEEPDYPEKPTGTTPKSETITYLTGLQLQKFAMEGGKEIALSGAQFEITASVLNKVVVNETKYEEAADGTYYLLKDGTYTGTDPVFNDDETLDTSKYYENVDPETKTVTRKFKLVSTTRTETVEEKDNKKTYTAFVDANGILNLKGLAAGTYEIKEIKAPNGYNLLKEPIIVEIDWRQPDSTLEKKECIWTVKQDGEVISTGSETGKDENGQPNGKEDNTSLYIVKVENKAGSLLPSTGGIGTTIFYVTGSILVLAAVVLLVTKKRMGKDK